MLHTSLHTATFPVSAWVTFSTVALTQAGHVARPAQVQVGGRRDLTYWEDSKVTEVGKTCGHVCNLPTELPVRLDPGTQAASLLLLCQTLSRAGSPSGLASWPPRAALDSAFPAQVHEDERLSQGSRSRTCLTPALSHAPVSGQTLC